MRTATQLGALSVALIGLAILPALGADPSQDDVEIVAFSNGPGCGAADGSIKFRNNSSEYYYRVTFDVKVKNDNLGEEQCDNDPPDCNGEDCECDIEGTWDLDITTELQAGDGHSCLLPNCLECEQHCDNTNPSCEPTSHCTCIYGQFRLTHYSVNGFVWLDMPPSFPTPIEETDLVRPAECPTQGMNPPLCNY